MVGGHELSLPLVDKVALDGWIGKRVRDSIGWVELLEASSSFSNCLNVVIETDVSILRTSCGRSNTWESVINIDHLHQHTAGSS
jgi:hypothetical protein